MRNNVLSAGIIFTLVSSVSNHFNQYMMKDDVILMLIDLIKCIFLNFAVSLTFPVARDPRVVLNECLLKKVELICDTYIQILRKLAEKVSQLL